MGGLLAVLFLVASVMWLFARGGISLFNSGSKDMYKLSDKLNSTKTSKWADKL